MSDAEERTSNPDDTAAFQRFYGNAPEEKAAGKESLLHRLFVGWWKKPA